MGEAYWKPEREREKKLPRSLPRVVYGGWWRGVQGPEINSAIAVESQLKPERTEKYMKSAIQS